LEILTYIVLPGNQDWVHLSNHA